MHRFRLGLAFSHVDHNLSFEGNCGLSPVPNAFFLLKHSGSSLSFYFGNSGRVSTTLLSDGVAECSRGEEDGVGGGAGGEDDDGGGGPRLCHGGEVDQEGDRVGTK